MQTYTVAIQPSPKGRPLYPLPDDGWTELRGCAGRVDASRKDTAVAEAVAAGVPYDVIEHDGQTAGGTRIAGTAIIIDRL